MENPLSRFTTRVENYIKYRPRYPQVIIDLLQRECHQTTSAIIADIGSGTGLLAELFLNNGYRVFGIEPDLEMRAAAEWFLQEYPRFTSIAATAEATSLVDHSIDVVTAGQAFHWFDREQTRREFLRVLVRLIVRSFFCVQRSHELRLTTSYKKLGCFCQMLDDMEPIRTLKSLGSALSCC